jgi:hypothetical protein
MQDRMIDRRALIAGAGGLGLAASSAATAVRAAQADAPGAALYGPPDPAIPKLGLRWAFSARVIFADRFTINAPVPRGYTSVGVGEVWGPRLQGRVLPHSGADYYKNTFNTFYTLEASDGALIFIHNRGSKRKFEAQPTAGQDPVPAANPDPSVPGGWVRFRATPTFTAPVGPHNWMNHTLFVANAAKHQNPDHTVFTYYEVL